MSFQPQLQKKPPAKIPAQAKSNGLASRGFDTQSNSSKVRSENKQQSDLKTQLSQAKRFGHNLNQMSAPTAVQNKVETIQRQEEAEPEQMKSEQSAQTSIQRQAAPNPASSGSSNSLPGGVRAKMENSFGTSFSNVSIKTDSAQAKSLGALAFTQGNNVHFAPGHYNPHTSSGQALLGHELTHVVQQRAGRVPVPHQSKGSPVNADPSLETEADQLGAKAAHGESVKVPGASGGMAASNASPVQNSTQPVQFFLPLLMAGLRMAGPMMMGGGKGGGLLGGLMGGGKGGGLLGGLMGAGGGMLQNAAHGAMGGAMSGLMGGQQQEQ